MELPKGGVIPSYRRYRRVRLVPIRACYTSALRRVSHGPPRNRTRAVDVPSVPLLREFDRLQRPGQLRLVGVGAGGRKKARPSESCNTRSVMALPLVCACQDSPKGVAWDGWARSTGRGFPVLVLPLHICGGGVCSTYLLCRWQPPLRIGGCAITDQAHSPFLRRGLNEVTTYESEAAKHCTPMVLGVGVQFVVQSLQSDTLRHKPARSGRGSVSGVQRTLYRCPRCCRARCP